MDNYSKKLEEENAALQKRNMDLEERCKDLLEREKKLDEEIVYFNSRRVSVTAQVELMARLVVQFENERNLDIKENNDISPAMEEWNKFNEKTKDFKKFKRRKYPMYDRLQETPNLILTPEEVAAYKFGRPLGDFTEEEFAWDGIISKWRYNDMSDEEKKEYDSYRKHMDELLRKYYYNES